MKYILLIISLVTISCNWAKDKSKEAVNKTGEVVAKTGAEFVQGASRGIQSTFQNEIVISDPLKKQGIKTGKILIGGTDSTTDNVLTAYLIFDQNFNNKITVKVLDENGLEYGRITQQLQANAGDARYVDFPFDKRTNIDSKGKLVFE